MLASHRKSRRDELQRFLFEHIESYEELELAILLRRRREQDWNAEAAAEQLGLPVGACQSALEGLAQRGIVGPGALTKSFRYSPFSLEVAARLVQLDECYRNQRLTVVMLMSVNAIERLRIATIHRFADTLRLRDQKQQGPAKG